MLRQSENPGGDLVTKLRIVPTLALLACLAPGPWAGGAGAQVIRGVVVDSTTRSRMTDVLVFLSDSTHQELKRRHVDMDGEFEFAVPGPGRYSIRAERFGMTTDTVGRIDVAPGDTVSITMELAQLSVARLVEELGKIVDLDAERLPPVEEGGRVPEGGARETDWITHDEDGGVIVGQVQEAGAAVMEAGGRVGLVHVGLAADVDAEGRFVIPGLPEGTYELAYLRPSMGELDWEYPLVEAAVRPGDTTAVSLQPAHPHRVLAQACGLDQWKPFTGVLAGHVVLPLPGSAAPGIRVTAEWYEPHPTDPFEGRAMTALALTNSRGAFRFCGIPTDRTTVEVTAGERTNRVSVTMIMSDDKPVATITLQLPGAPSGGGR